MGRKEKAVGKRRDGRLLVVQFLYQNDIGPKKKVDEGLDLFWELTKPTQGCREFAVPLIEGILSNLKKLDATISKYSKNWNIKRMAPVDRNILRMALYEMYYCNSVPPVVAINEAIEIAKQISSEESSRFVNGMLDRARKDLDRPAREAKK